MLAHGGDVVLLRCVAVKEIVWVKGLTLQRLDSTLPCLRHSQHRAAVAAAAAPRL
jgi:hypothetical protein